MNRKPEMPATPHEEGEPFGNLLKERRLAQGISLDEAAARTRIRPVFLEALEEDRFGTIPGEAYVYGFLRTYSGFLGFEPDEMVASYNQRFHSSQVVLPSPGEEQEKAGFSVNHLRLLWGIALLVLAAVLAISALRCSREESSAPPDSAVNTAESAPVVPPLAGEDRPSEVRPAEAGEDAELPVQGTQPGMVSPEGDPAGRPMVVPLVFVPAGGGMLKAESLGSGWLEITIDDRPTQRYQLEPKAVLKWRIGETFHLETERPGLLFLELDGRRIDLGERTALHVGPEPVAGRE